MFSSLRFPLRVCGRFLFVLNLSETLTIITRGLLTELRPRLDSKNMPLLIFVNKGIEISTHSLTLEVIADTCGPEVAKAATFLSGPSFAKEIVRRQPTSVTIASFSNLHAERASQVFHQPWFRCYTWTDPIGVELAGALKNVYAIATGVADGLGFENNTRASTSFPSWCTISSRRDAALTFASSSAHHTRTCRDDAHRRCLRRGFAHLPNSRRRW